MALTDREIRKIEPGTVLAKLSDGGGLQLWVMPDGAKRWRLAYRYNGKQKTFAIGVYPTTSLREARDARDDARRLLGLGQDPSLVRKMARGAKAEADERVRIMDWWAGRSREMEAGDTIIPLRATGQIVG